jgi:hypothetical protein
MPNRGRDTVIVSPPTFDRTEFARVDQALSAPHTPLDRDWLMARFSEGLQIRLLKPPQQGLILFQPGKLAWRPIEGAERALVVHDLRVAPGPMARDGAARLWSVAEGFARYYGFVAVLALIGPGPGLIARDRAPGRGWVALDTADGDVRLVGNVLQGPMALPRLPRDWALRAAALGRGLVIQTSGESYGLERQARDIMGLLSAQGIPARHERFANSDTLRARAVRPAAAYSVVLDGQVIGGPELSAAVLLERMGGGLPRDQSPS